MLFSQNAYPYTDIGRTLTAGISSILSKWGKDPTFFRRWPSGTSRHDKEKIVIRWGWFNSFIIKAGPG